MKDKLLEEFSKKQLKKVSISKVWGGDRTYDRHIAYGAEGTYWVYTYKSDPVFVSE